MMSRDKEEGVVMTSEPLSLMKLGRLPLAGKGAKTLWCLLFIKDCIIIRIVTSSVVIILLGHTRESEKSWS